MPTVSVLMAAHDAERWLRPAVDSILSQSLRDIELVVVDDGSVDSTGAILSAYAAADPRVRVLRLAGNRGLPEALNAGLTVCQAELIARMDADDIAHPTRLEQQVAYLSARPEVGLLGGQAVVIDAEDRRCGILSMPQESPTVRWRSILANPFIHSTVMFRRALLPKGQLAFAPSLRSAQDYDLWCRMLASASGANLPVPLISYRVFSHSITGRRRTEQLANHAAISNRQALRILAELAPGNDELEFMRANFVWRDREGGDDPSRQARAIKLLFRMAEDFFRRENLDAAEQRVVRDDAAVTVLQGLRASSISIVPLLLLGRHAPLFPIEAVRAWARRRKMLASASFRYSPSRSV